MSTPAPGAYNTAYSQTSAFDLCGNSTTFLTGSNAFSFNADNQDTAASYNGNGDPLSVSVFGSAQSVTFDPEDRLTNLSAFSFKAAYDGDGLRTWSYPAEGDTTFYLYDGDTPIVEFDSQANFLARRHSATI